MKHQRTLRNWGGFANPPHPGGVPVKIISPGSKVQNLRALQVKLTQLKRMNLKKLLRQKGDAIVDSVN